MSRVFIYGVDGGSYQLINCFIEQGYLPNYAKLMKIGAAGKFISTIPPHTAPGWASISTGVHPGTHGIYQFWKTQSEDYIGNYQGSKDWNVDPFWKILNDYNLKTGVINVPMTHPPTKLDGFMISWPLSKTLNYCYPKTLLNDISKAGGYFYPDIYIMYNGQKDYLQTACEITQKRVKTIQYLIENKEWDFLMTVFPEIDRISHFYWNYMDEKSPYYIENSDLKDAVLQMYIEVDKAMGEIVSSLPEDTLFVSLSDHGFCVGTINFNIDSFLIEKGYMTLIEVESKNIEKDNQDTYIYGDWFHTSWQGKNYEVDWSKTKAYISAPGSYGINFNLSGRQQKGIVTKAETEKLYQQLRKDLLEIKHPLKDVPLFKNVVTRDMVYKGKSLEMAPDILLIPDDYSIMVSHNLVMGEIFSEPEQKGMHCREGYILFSGPGVQSGKQLADSEVVDLVPTILKYYGIDIPEYIEGNTIDAFTKDYHCTEQLSKRCEASETADSKNQTGQSYSDIERQDIEQRLKSLGYL